MSLSVREVWTVLHGLILGTLFLLAFGGGLAGLWSLRPELVTPEGIRERMGRLVAGTWIMALVAWVTVISGTFIVYPWYRAPIPTSPRSTLLANPATKLWHSFGMEWKEHVAWIAPMLATAVAYVVWYYGRHLAHEDRVRKVAMVLYTLAFVSAGVAGLFGAFLNKVAPTR